MADDSVELSYIDLLYAVPVAVLATELTDGHTKLSQVTPSGWADVAVALTAVTLGWVGHHRNRRLAPRPPDPRKAFLTLRFPQFVVEVLVIVTYLALVTQVVLDGPASRSQLAKAAWLAGAFVLYLIWDGLDIRNSSHCARWQDRAKTGMKVTASFAVVFAALFLWTLDSTGHRPVPAALFDGIVILVLLAYRLGQEWRCNKRPTTACALSVTAHEGATGTASATRARPT